MSNHAVIMAGGIGSRFWPVSTPDMPKQFLDVLGSGRTLIQQTYDRLSPLCPPENVWVVTSERYAGIVRKQLPDIPADNVLLEPQARNTAPCIAYACRKIRLRHPDANVVVTPSDALVLDPQEYRRIIGEALDFTATSAAIVTIGIKPSRPETGYGYLRTSGSQTVLKVEAFTEKPDLTTAEGYLSSGNYFWNAGIFVWNVRTIEAALAKYAPGIAHIMDQLEPSLYKAGERDALAQLFPQCEKVSIDYAVMEKSPDIYTIPADFGWSDLGTWSSLLANAPKGDASGNVAIGTQAQFHGCSGCIVHSSSLKRIVIEGLDNYIVAEKDGHLLVCSLASEQHIKEYSE